MTIITLDEPLMPMRYAARLLCIHSNTLRRWGDKGLIKVYRINSRGDRRFSRNDVFSLLADLQANNGNPINGHKEY